jgi:PAS domain S-box-containing protein
MNDYHSGGSRLAELVRKIGLHDHLCIIYETQDEQLAAAVPFIKMGLERGEKCLYIADSNATAALMNAMREQEINVDAAVRQGSLTITNKEIYPHQSDFEPDRMIELLAEAVRAARSAGLPALRVAGEMAWVARIDPRPERLMEFEAKFNRFVRDHDILGLCQYDRSLFQPEVILNILRTHPTVVYGGFICENPYYVPPDEFLHPQHRDHEVQRMLARIREDAANKERLRQSEERIRLVVDTIPQQIWSGSPDGTLDFCNERWRSYVGLSLEELQGDGWQSMLHPEDRDRVLRAWRESVENGTPYEQEERHRGADGQYCWFLCRSLPMRDAEGRIVKWYGTNTDIEDRKRAEDALRRSEAYLAEAQKLSHTGSWAYDPVRRMPIYWSQEWYRISGLDPAKGPSDEEIRALHTPEEWARLMGVIDRAMKDKSDYQTDTQLVFPDGSTKDIHIVGRPVVNASGDVVELLGTVMDVTERKRAAEAVRRSEAYLAAAQRLTHVGSWSLDLSTGELLWSAETFRIFSFEPAASADLHNMFLRRIHPEDRPMIEQGLKNALTITEPFEVEYRIVWPDGSVKAIRESVFPRLGKSGEVLERYGVVADITERKQAENDLRRLSGRLLQLQDEERRRIARDLHDSTGQDLVALATMIGQLRTSIPSRERKSRKLLSECKALADRCIREVRTLSYVLYPPALEQAGLAGAIRDYVRGFTERSGIHVGLELSPDVGRMARDVELALFRVVQESLANIQRHSGSRHAKIRMDPTSDLVLEISDSGRAASSSLPRHAPRSPFQFGVGIQSMQERVNLIGGRLEIDSTTRGTTVRVTVPLGDEREKASHSIS